MARTQTMVQLNDELVAELDQEAARRACSRSALIRVAVEELLGSQANRAKEQAWIAGYLRIPQDQPDDWGNLIAQAEADGHRLAQRLDADADRNGQAW
jgi:metal-responsive CopG/Arc/MetJ family transcriptional regulator